MLARQAPWFDRVLVEPGRPGGICPACWRLTRQLRGLRPRLRPADLRPLQPVFLGSPAGRHGRASPAAARIRTPIRARDAMHTLDRQREQLAHGRHRDFSGARSVLAGRTERFDAAAAVRAAGARRGAAPPGKRWPAERFARAGASCWRGRGMTPVVLGTRRRSAARRDHPGACPAARRPHRRDRSSPTSPASPPARRSRSATTPGRCT